jgi:signal transduction histidine kinase
MTFRRRIILAMVPLFALVLAFGGTGTVLLYRLGNRIDQILRENYDSVIYMRDLNEALERIDSSFQFALAGREQESVEQYEANWHLFDASLAKEQRNITLPGEGALADKLAALSKRYREQGDVFFAQAGPQRPQVYFGGQDQAGLFATFREIKAISGKILRINQDNMEQANRNARGLARSALLWYGGGLVLGLSLAVLLVGRTIRIILYPIRAVTESAMAIGAGNLDQLVPVTFEDELGGLAGAFNTMAKQLREYRQSHQAELILAHQTSQATINSFPDAVLVVDQHQWVELANPVARRLLGVLPPEPGKNQHMEWQPPEPLRQPLAEALRDQREYSPEGFDRAIQLDDGNEVRFFLPRILPIRSPEGATLGAAIVLEDITRFRLLDEVKSNLVATVSHQLKTPLTSIRLVLYLLLEETVGPLTPKQLELLVDARDNAERLLVMINNLLDLARLEEGRTQLRLRPERPVTLLQLAAESFAPRAGDQGIELTVEAAADLPPIAVDADQFQHAMKNLLDNAMAHTPRGGRITLEAVRADDKVIVSVTDTGSGIPAQYLPHVFEKYFRVPGDTAPGGSGLGLAIVRQIATAHRGSVTCESSAGKGAIFRLFLPVWADEQTTIAQDHNT